MAEADETDPARCLRADGDAPGVLEGATDDSPPVTVSPKPDAPPPIATRSWAASISLHSALIVAIFVVGLGVAPDATWAGTQSVPAMSSLWREAHEPVEPPAEAPPPAVHLEPPPPPKTLLVDPVLPEVDPVPDADALAEADRVATVDESPSPDWTARVASKPQREDSKQAEPQKPASAPSAESALVQPSPIPGRNPPPEYPHAARKAGLAGEVTVLLEIAADGTVDAAHVEVSSGYAALDDAALLQLSKWTFEPARRAGVAVRGAYRTVVEFALQPRRRA